MLRGPFKLANVTTTSGIVINVKSFYYNRIQALDNIQFSIPLGSLSAIIGPNGGGKSTLLKLISGILPLKEGEINGVGRGADLAYLPQSKDIDCTFPIHVEDVVAMGLWRRAGSFRKITRQDREEISSALSQVGLSGFEKRNIDALSGGQLQRLFFARVIAQDAKIILLDEPFTGVDGKTIKDLLDIISRWHKTARTVIAVMHDLTIVKAYFPHSALISKSLIAAGNTDDVLQTDVLAKAAFYV